MEKERQREGQRQRQRGGISPVWALKSEKEATGQLRSLLCWEVTWSFWGLWGRGWSFWDPQSGQRGNWGAAGISHLWTGPGSLCGVHPWASQSALGDGAQAPTAVTAGPPCVAPPACVLGSAHR